MWTIETDPHKTIETSFDRQAQNPPSNAKWLSLSVLLIENRMAVIHSKNDKRYCQQVKSAAEYQK